MARSLFAANFHFYSASPFFSGRQLGGIIRGSVAQEARESQGSTDGKVARKLSINSNCSFLRHRSVRATTFHREVQLHNLLICDVIAKPVGHLVDEARFILGDE